VKNEQKKFSSYADLFGQSKSSSFVVSRISSDRKKIRKVEMSTTSASSHVNKFAGKPDFYQKHLFHLSGVALIGLIPAALLLSPSKFNFPIDVALGFVVPIHGHLGTVLVLDDYIPGKLLNKSSKVLLWVCTILAGAGLLQLNLQGLGITESFKRLWKKPQPQIEQKH